MYLVLARLFMFKYTVTANLQVSQILKQHKQLQQAKGLIADYNSGCELIYIPYMLHITQHHIYVVSDSARLLKYTVIAVPQQFLKQYEQLQQAKDLIADYNQDCE